jgi:hypothetical protein
MLQGLAQFGIALLEFFEQPDVFDSDDRLIRERLKQLYLSVTERPDFLAADIDGANGDTFAKQRGY